MASYNQFEITCTDDLRDSESPAFLREDIVTYLFQQFPLAKEIGFQEVSIVIQIHESDLAEAKSTRENLEDSLARFIKFATYTWF